MAGEIPPLSATLASPSDRAAEPTSPKPELVLDRLADAVIVSDRAATIRLTNPAAERLLGYSPGALTGTPLLAIVPPRFRAAHQAGFAAFFTTGPGVLVGGPSVQVAAMRADGSEVPVELTLAAIGNPGDPDVAVVATLRDVTRRVELEREALLSQYLQATVDASRDGVLAWAPDGRVLAVNQRFCEMFALDAERVTTGSDAHNLLGEQLSSVVEARPLVDALAWAREHPGETQTLEVRLSDGRVIDGYGAPVTDAHGDLIGRVWYVHDDTDRRVQETQRSELLAELAGAQRAQAFLLEASSALARASGFNETLEALAQVAVPALGDLCLIDVLNEAGRPQRLAAVHADPRRQDLVDELRERYAPSVDGEHPSVFARQTRRSEWAADMSDTFLRATTRDERHYEIVKKLGFTSYMTVPLTCDGDVLGTITIVSAGSGRRFGVGDVALTEELAQRVALVVAKERRYDTERMVSHTLQANLLPTDVPHIEGIEVAVRYLPGTTDAQVGGDFWDISVVPSGEVAIAVGDVAGHDITAAATMAQLRSAVRALRSQVRGPDELVGLLHGCWDQLGLDRMATAAFARLDRVTGRLRLASAGHLPPLIVEPNRAWLPSLEPAVPFGAPSGEAPKLWTGELPRGSTIVFYTDGLVEDRRRDIDEGTGRLIRAAMTAPDHTPETLINHILAELSGDDRADDVAIVAVHRPAARDRGDQEAAAASVHGHSRQQGLASRRTGEPE